jgi:hypothetical protein
MAEQPKSRPILIPPLAKAPAPLEVIHERPQPHHGPEHPHCDEHFLFTPHCAACLEAERIGTATTQATPIASMPGPASKSSRSFGFTDDIPYSLLHEPTYSEQLTDWEVNQIEAEIIADVVDTILDI